VHVAFLPAHVGPAMHHEDDLAHGGVPPSVVTGPWPLL
jgi:hypothetical protein